MDPQIAELVAARKANTKMELSHRDQTLALLNDDGTPGQALPVKPLAQLYGSGTGLDHVEFDDQRFLAVLMAIEEAIFDADRRTNRLTDSAVLIALDRLCMTPDAPVTNDPVADLIQFSLRVTLSLNDFSRQDVRQCLRKVKQSCARHSKTGGVRGYVDFIHEQFSRQ
jgi:hypothetical protein